MSKHHERTTSQTSREVWNQDEQGQVAGSDPQEPCTGVQVHPITELQDHYRDHLISLILNFILMTRMGAQCCIKHPFLVVSPYVY